MMNITLLIKTAFKQASMLCINCVSTKITTEHVKQLQLKQPRCRAPGEHQFISLANWKTV